MYDEAGNLVIVVEVDHLTTFAVMRLIDVVEGVFSDIAGHWAAEFIMNLYELGIIEGYEDGTYRPNIEVNRAEFTKMVLAAFDIDVPETVDEAPFSDVETGLWYTPYIAKAKELGIVEGYADGTFRPTATVNRVEALKIVLEASGLAIEGGEMVFPDTIDGAWYEKYVAFAQLMEVVGGYSDGTFGPENSLLRSEVAKIVWNVMEL